MKDPILYIAKRIGKWRTSRIMKIILALLCIIPLVSSASASSIFKDQGVGISIEKSLLMSGKLKYSDIISYDNSTKYYGGFVESGNDIRRHTIPQHDNLGPIQFSKRFYVIVDPPSQIQNRLPFITIVSNLDSFHTQSQMKTSEFKYTKEEKARSVIISSNTMRWVDDSCREAKIAWNNWQVLLPDTIQYLKSGCDPKITKINTITNQTKILTKHDITTSAKYKLESFYGKVKGNCSQKRNSCTEINNKAVTTMRDVR